MWTRKGLSLSLRSLPLWRGPNRSRLSFAYNIFWTPKRTEVTFRWFAFWFTLSELGLVLLNQTICETPLNRYTLKDQFSNLNKENVFRAPVRRQWFAFQSQERWAASAVWSLCGTDTLMRAISLESFAELFYYLSHLCDYTSMSFPNNFSFSNQRWHWFSDIKCSFLFLLHHRVYWLSKGSVLESGHTYPHNRHWDHHGSWGSVSLYANL